MQLLRNLLSKIEDVIAEFDNLYFYSTTSCV